MTAQVRRLNRFRALLGDIHRALDTDIAFALWDGSFVPADASHDALHIAFADEGAVAHLVRRPTFDTVIQLLAAGRVDIRGGSLFDLAARRPKVKAKAVLKALKPHRHLGMLGFWFAPKGEALVLDALAKGTGSQDGAETSNKANVAYHYDVSNDFYRLFLDEEMVYTCAYFSEWHWDIDRAQRDKLDMICRKLRLKPGERFLDIGCGWGALICHAAEHYGVEAHGVTLAEEQLAEAKARIARRGLEGRVTLHLRDYALMEGQFDKIASIGMFEQVGLRNHDTYFSSVKHLLRPGGLYLHHTIARPAKRSQKAFRRRSAEYNALTKYIFPGGELDHLGLSIANLQSHGFEVHDVEGWREHYQRTCRIWHDRLLARRSEAEALVGPVRTRMWLLYLAGCSLAFERGGAVIFQTLASRRVKGASELPPSRADLYC